MKNALFKELVTSVREGGAILRGEIAPTRKFVIDKGNEKRNQSKKDRRRKVRIRRVQTEH